MGKRQGVEGAAGGDRSALADRMHSAAVHLLRQLRREDGAAGLSAPRLSALSVVVFGGARTVGQLAEAEQVRPPTMTRLVQALERDGLVRRASDPRDGRVVRIHETARGRRLLLAGRERRVAALAGRLAELGRPELEVLDEATSILERLLGGGPPGQPPRFTRSK